MDIIYEKTRYTMIGKTKLGCGMNMNFFDLDDKDLGLLCLYENETVRYKGIWFVVKSKSATFADKATWDACPENWIKYPYRKAIPIIHETAKSRQRAEGKK